MNYNLSIIIVNYNNYWDTIQIMEALALQQYITFHLYIIDNNSPNESLVELRKSISSNSSLIVNNENVGYAQGVNQGLRLALENRFQYSLVINNDIEFKSHTTIKNLMEVAYSNPNYAVLSPLILNNSVPVKIFYHRPSILDIASGELLSLIKFRFSKMPVSKLLSVYRAYGCCMLVDNYQLSRINFLDNNTFLYSEEEILAERLISIGSKTGLIMNEMIEHYESVSVKKILSIWQIICYQSSSKKYYLEKYRKCNRILTSLVIASYMTVNFIKLLLKNIISRFYNGLF